MWFVGVNLISVGVTRISKSNNVRCLLQYILILYKTYKIINQSFFLMTTSENFQKKEEEKKRLIERTKLTRVRLLRRSHIDSLLYFLIAYVSVYESVVSITSIIKHNVLNRL